MTRRCAAVRDAAGRARSGRHAMCGMSESLPMRTSEARDDVAGRHEQRRLHVLEVVRLAALEEEVEGCSSV
jgi:hypothetical protein